MINNNISGYLAAPIVMLIELTADSSIKQHRATEHTHLIAAAGCGRQS